MSSQRALQSVPTSTEQPQRGTRRVYFLEQLLDKSMLDMPRSTFLNLLQLGKLPFVQELKPRLGKHARYRAEPIDRYLAGQWQQPRAFASVHRRPHLHSTVNVASARR